MGTDAYILKRQQALLEARQHAIKCVDDDAREKIDTMFWNKLRDASSSRLAPVLVRRNHEPWFVAFLVQPIGDGGQRLLVIEDEWRITRVKRSATVVRVKPAQEAAHADAVSAQQRLKTDIARLLETRKCRITKGKKASKDPKSPRRTIENSLRCAN